MNDLLPNAKLSDTVKINIKLTLMFEAENSCIEEAASKDW